MTKAILIVPQHQNTSKASKNINSQTQSNIYSITSSKTVYFAYELSFQLKIFIGICNFLLTISTYPKIKSLSMFFYPLQKQLFSLLSSFQSKSSSIQCLHPKFQGCLLFQFSHIHLSSLLKDLELFFTKQTLYLSIFPHLYNFCFSQSFCLPIPGTRSFFLLSSLVLL